MPEAGCPSSVQHCLGQDQGHTELSCVCLRIAGCSWVHQLLVSLKTGRVLGSGRSWSSEGRDQTNPDSDSLWAQLLQEMQREGQVPAQKVAGWFKDWAGPGTRKEPVGVGGQGSGRR